MQGLNPLYHQVSVDVIDEKDEYILLSIIVQDIKANKYYRTNIFQDILSEEDNFKKINNPEAPVFVEVKPKTVTVYEECTTDSQNVSRG